MCLISLYFSSKWKDNAKVFIRFSIAAHWGAAYRAAPISFQLKADFEWSKYIELSPKELQLLLLHHIISQI